MSVRCCCVPRRVCASQVGVVDAFASKIALQANDEAEAADAHHYAGWHRGCHDLSDAWVRGGLVPPAARVGPTLAAGGLHRDVDGSTSARSDMHSLLPNMPAFTTKHALITAKHAPITTKHALITTKHALITRSSRARSPRPRTPPASRSPLLAAISPRRSPRDPSRSAAAKPSTADVPRCDLPPAQQQHSAASEAPRRRALKPRTMSYHGAPAVPKRPRGAGATSLKPAQRPAARPSKPKPAPKPPKPAPKPAARPAARPAAGRAARASKYRPPAAWQPARVDHSAEIADHLSRRLGV